MSHDLHERLREALGELEDLEPQRDLVGAAARAAPVPTRRAWMWLTPLAAAMALAMLLVLVRDGEQLPSRAAANDVLVMSVSGVAWLVDATGRRPLHDGDTVPQGGDVETEAGASAMLVNRGVNLIAVRESSRGRWREVDEATRFDVDSGVVRVEARDAMTPIIVGISGTATQVRISVGVVGVAAGSGGGSIAVIEGSALMQRDADVQVVAAGREVVVTRDEVSDVVAELRLALAPLAPRTAASVRLVIYGETAPGVIVRVQGVDVAVDANGRFAAEVDVVPGQRRLVVTARDALDRARRAVLTLRQAPAPRGPRQRPLETHWEWEPIPG